LVPLEAIVIFGLRGIAIFGPSLLSLSRP
jgi:hypothetical protein